MIKITLDTNVLVSATFWTGDSFKILCMLDEGNIKNFVSKEIIDEYLKILKSDEIIEKVKNKNLIVSKVVHRVLLKSVLVEPKNNIRIVKDDPDDDKFIQVAVESKSDYIISQDKHLLNIDKYKGIKILHPKEFLVLAP